MIKEISTNYKKPNRFCLSEKHIGKSFVTIRDSNFYKSMFPRGTIVKFLGISVPEIKGIPAMSVFLFPDRTQRFLDPNDISHLESLLIKRDSLTTQ